MKLPIVVSDDSKEPIYYQMELQIKRLIVSGQLQAGTALPSIRALSHDLSCSVITTRRAYQNLENNGYIETVQGKGTFVRALESSAQKQIREEVVYSTFKKAIEESKLMGYSLQELKEISDKVFDDLERGGDRS
ncbi:GntR family transcriptional regulator [Gracilibacillus salitolerans]|uniref:GntR family transcriptional regulator n=1 Tax=Gracilibacillus salitolerans TaxID=2663022 RepID=A0A5Q2TDY4_9BACI|nr:GntR family transcriptional regulator [Gracilibacillus salitolerans]QGH32959.1 GntR family transcriptional regulator [Gracilibacillus salitolerans]